MRERENGMILGGLKDQTREEFLVTEFYVREKVNNARLWVP